MRRVVVRTAAVAVIAAVAGFGLFGSSGSLDPAKVQRLVRTLLETKVGVHVRSVACPSGVKLHKGLVSYCTATLIGGHTVRVRLTQTDGNGDGVVAPAEMVADEVQQTIFESFYSQGILVTATCPQHLPIVVGNTFFCAVKDSYGRSGRIRITITDRDGGYHTSAR